MINNDIQWLWYFYKLLHVSVQGELVYRPLLTTRTYGS
jgi:hypothetical protein